MRDLIMGGLLYFGLLVSYLMIARKIRDGWWVLGLINAGFAAYAIMLRQWTWIPFNAIFVFTALYSWKAYGQEEEG